MTPAAGFADAPTVCLTVGAVAIAVAVEVVVF